MANHVSICAQWLFRSPFGVSSSHHRLRFPRWLHPCRTCALRNCSWTYHGLAFERMSGPFEHMVCFARLSLFTARLVDACWSSFLSVGVADMRVDRRLCIVDCHKRPESYTDLCSHYPPLSSFLWFDTGGSFDICWLASLCLGSSHRLFRL